MRYEAEIKELLIENAIHLIAEGGFEKATTKELTHCGGQLPDFTGWSLDALKYIYETRNAAANGHETLDTDASAEAAKAEDLACERYVLEKGKLQIEVLCNLDQVAPAGAVLLAAWPRIEGATGLPVRVWAITE